MDVRMFCRKYEFFKKADRKKNEKNGWNQAQQENTWPLGKEKLIDQKVFWNDQEEQQKYKK